MKPTAPRQRVLIHRLTGFGVEGDQAQSVLTLADDGVSGVAGGLRRNAQLQKVFTFPGQFGVISLVAHGKEVALAAAGGNDQNRRRTSRHYPAELKPMS